jgi:ABC-type nitrate/sulfonate/bicarbonate transport system permease component
MIGLATAWTFLPHLMGVEHYIFPDLPSVLREFGSETKSLALNALYTTVAAAGGLAVAVLCGSIWAAAAALAPSLRTQTMPLLVASNSIPVVAIAPLMALWFGYGLISKAAVAAFLCFFPYTLSLLDGVARTRKVFSELLVTLGASRMECFVHLTLPASVAHAVTGLKISASIAVIGAVVAEFIGSDRGIGFGMLQATYNFNTTRLFAYILVACGLSLTFYSLPRQLEVVLHRRGYIVE